MIKKKPAFANTGAGSIINIIFAPMEHPLDRSTVKGGKINGQL